jgi:hypothetical protein
MAYKRISSLELSHDPSPYMAEMGCMSSTLTKNPEFLARHVRRCRKGYQHGVKKIISEKLHYSLFDK